MCLQSLFEDPFLLILLIIAVVLGVLLWRKADKMSSEANNPENSEPVSK